MLQPLLPNVARLYQLVGRKTIASTGRSMLLHRVHFAWQQTKMNPVVPRTCVACLNPVGPRLFRLFRSVAWLGKIDNPCSIHNAASAEDQSCAGISVVVRFSLGTSDASSGSTAKLNLNAAAGVGALAVLSLCDVAVLFRKTDLGSSER